MAGSFDLPAPGGRIVFVGLFQGEVTFNDPNFHRRELTLLASRNALPGTFRDIIRLIEAGRMDITAWISHRFDLAETPQRFPEIAGEPRRHQDSHRGVKTYVTNGITRSVGRAGDPRSGFCRREIEADTAVMKTHCRRRPLVLWSTSLSFESGHDRLPPPMVGVHLVVMPTGKVFMMSAESQLAVGVRAIWDPAWPTIFTDRPSPYANQFCSGHTLLADGRILITGGDLGQGEGILDSDIFDPFTETWTDAAEMTLGPLVSHGDDTGRRQGAGDGRDQRRQADREHSRSLRPGGRYLDAIAGIGEHVLSLLPAQLSASRRQAPGGWLLLRQRADARAQPGHQLVDHDRQHAAPGRQLGHVSSRQDPQLRITRLSRSRRSRPSRPPACWT